MQILPIGEKVNTDYGVFEIINYDNIEERYFCYQQGFSGHSGVTHFGHKYIDTKYEGNCCWFDANGVSLIEESKVKIFKTNKFKKGDKVKVVGETRATGVNFGGIYTIKNPSDRTTDYCDGREESYHVSLEEADGTPNEDCLELYIEPRNYREMKPTDLITISIDGNEFEIPIKAMLLISDLTGRVSPNHYTDNFYEETQRILGANGYREFHLGNEDSVYYGNLKNDKGYLNFFKPYYDKQHKEKEELHNLISKKQSELDKLLEKLAQM